jgi:hypothetical protein
VIPLKNLPTGDLANISCRTEKIISALELPGGASVIHLNPSETSSPMVASVLSLGYYQSPSLNSNIGIVNEMEHQLLDTP